jgi:hypothetical protein
MPGDGDAIRVNLGERSQERELRDGFVQLLARQQL